ncbi:MAG: Ada metal-binding domain-containing protein [Armatimonadota bacterium]
MSKIEMLCIFVIIFTFSLTKTSLSEEAPPGKTFTEAVISSTINLLPDNIKSYIAPFEAEIAKGAVIKQTSAKINTEAVYYVRKKIGSGPKMLTDQFKLVSKNVREDAAGAVTSANLGRLTAYVISLCQPYHTDDAAYLSAAHKVFEQKLDSSNAAYTASADGFIKVSNPSQYAIALAQKGNALLAKINSAESTSVENEYFNLCVNSVVDCWLTVLQQPVVKQVTQNANPAGGYIGNIESKKFHMPTCRFLPGDKNRTVLNSREEAVNKGFIPCKVCKP